MLVAPKPLKLKAPKPISTPQMETAQYPTSVSISELLRAGQLTKPKLKNHVSLVLGRYDVKFGTWNDDMTLELLVESEKFSAGGFRDAFLATSANPADKTKWVIKLYNEAAKDTILNVVKSSEEDHTRKQVQMHSAARHLAEYFRKQAPKEFGKTFWYNRAYYVTYQEQPATI